MSINIGVPNDILNALIEGRASKLEYTLVFAAVAVVFLGLKLLVFVMHFARLQSKLSAIPEAKGKVPILGHALCLLREIPWDAVARWAAENGGIARFRVLEKQCIVVCDPKGLKRIFQTAYQTYAKDLAWSYHPFLSILGTGLVTADGHLWRTQRLLMTPTLRIDILDDIIRIAQKAVDRLSAKLEPYRGTGKPIDIEEEYRLLTLQVIGEAILSLPAEECDRVFPELYLPVMEESNRRVLRPWRKYLPTASWFDYNSRVRRLNSYIIGILRLRWNHLMRTGASLNTGYPDLLDRLLSHLKEKVEEGEATWGPAMEVQLCYEIKTFLLAGHETSAAMLTWSTFELSQHERCLKGLRADTERVYRSLAPGQVPKKEAVEGMEYTLGTLKEALRKYSVVPVVTRVCTADDEVMGYTVPKWTNVMISLQAVHHSWKAPLEFRPERFVTGGEYDQFDEEIRPYMFVPFIAGPRNCLGQHLALLEARVVLGSLWHRFTFTPVRGAAAGQRHESVIPVGPKYGMEVTIT